MHLVLLKVTLIGPSCCNALKKYEIRGVFLSLVKCGYSSQKSGKTHLLVKIHLLHTMLVKLLEDFAVAFPCSLPVFFWKAALLNDYSSQQSSVFQAVLREGCSWAAAGITCSNKFLLLYLILNSFCCVCLPVL